MPIKLSEVIGFLVASRVPNLIIIGYVQFATAYFMMDKSLIDIIDIKYFFLILSTTMVGSAGYIINDYFDRKIDMVNRPESVVVGSTLRRRIAIIIHLLLSLGGIFIGGIIDPVIGLIHTFSTIVLLVYSSSLKKSLLVDTIAISFLTSLTLLLVLIYFEEVHMLVLAYASFAGVAIFIRESLKDIISAKGDGTFGMNSIALKWGVRGSKLIIIAACLIGLVLLFYYLYHVPNWSSRYFFIGLLIFISWFLFKLMKTDTQKGFLQLKLYIDAIILSGLMSITFT